MKLPGFEDFTADSNRETWLEAAQEICRQHKIGFKRLMRAEHGDNIIFLVDQKHIVKIYHPSTPHGFQREKVALQTARTNIRIPEIVGDGSLDDYQYLITTQISGELMTRANWLNLEKAEQISILTELAEGLRELHQTDASMIDFDWKKFIAHQAETCFERQRACRVNERLLAEIPAYLEENLKLLPMNKPDVFMHGDVHFGNLRVEKSCGKWRISGLFDFADSLKGFYEYDFLAVCVLMIQGQGELQREFFRAYGYAESEINEELRKRQMLLAMFYECSDLRRYAIRLRPEAVDYSLLELERAIWNF